jgi:hypothetical protein
MKKVEKLTSVNILEDNYKKFKVNAINNNFNFQKLVNRSLDLYNKDESFRTMINNHNDLTVTGSKY